MELELRIDGVIASQNIAPNESLLTLLRREGHSSVRHGCETGECGACTVLVDGVPRPSCVMLAAQAGGCSVTTAANLGTAVSLHVLQQAFIETGAVQCGFCTPGMLLSAHALLQRTLSPSEDEVRDALSGNLCRCAGYSKPVQAILRAAAVLRHEQPSLPAQNIVQASHEASTTGGRLSTVAGAANRARAASAGVTTKIPVLTPEAIALASQGSTAVQEAGQAVPVINATKFVTGKSAFVGDSAPRGLLHARVLTSPHAHAIIRNIDITQAKAFPGVHAVLTYKDVPRIPYSSVVSAQAEADVQDRYCLDSRVRYVGDRVAVVAAETWEAAEQALALIRVEYEQLPALLDVRQALEPTAPRIHPEEDSCGIYDASRNIAARVRSESGNVEQGFAYADLVVEGEYATSPFQPAPIETSTVMTYIDEDNYLVVRTSSQASHHVRRLLSRLLGLPTRRIRVLKPEVGGSFGAKQEVLLEDLCALLTIVTQRPVRLEYTRAEQFRSGSAHQPYFIRIKTGLKRDGTIVANQIALLSDTGAYGSHALATRNAAVSALALYPCPNMRFAAEVCYTNHAPAGAFLDSALPQEFFALECHMDEVARQLGIDPLVLRRKNWIKAGDEYPVLHAPSATREVVESCGLSTCLKIVEEQLRWDERHRVVEEGRYRHGVGVALALHGTPGVQSDTSGAMLKLNEDGSFDVVTGASDSGSGSSTLIAQIAAETLGVSLDDVLLRHAGTDYTPFESGVSDASALYSSGGAVKKAAEQMRRQLLAVAGRMLNTLPEALKIQQGTISAPNGQQVTIQQVATHSLYVENRHIMTTASWKVPATPTAFAAQGVLVEVDTETGQVRVQKTVSAVDVGHALNPLVIEGQIQGSVARALGLSLSEELLSDQHGVLLSTDLSHYHIYSALDMPDMQTYLVETRDGIAPYGAKSVSEIAFYGIAPAIANAIYDAVGIKVRQIPFTPERMLRALHAQKRPS